MSTLFIVDDDKNILFPLSYWFKKKGYDVHTFENSSELFSVLYSQPPQFILMDVNLAGEHGGDICRYLKQELHLNYPIFLWSASVLTQEQYRNYGADGFVAKPVDLINLTQLIASYVTPAVS